MRVLWFVLVAVILAATLGPLAIILAPLIPSPWGDK